MSQESYIPSQTPESEDYTSTESSSLETPSESDYSIASSSQCSDSSDTEETLSSSQCSDSSYFDPVSDDEIYSQSSSDSD